MGRCQKDADHNRKRIEDDLDARGHILGAWVGQNLVGTVRVNLLREGDVGAYEALYRLHEISTQDAQHTSITTRMMVLPGFRGSHVAARLASDIYAFALSRGVLFDFIDCNAHLVSFFERLGYQVQHTAVHANYGPVTVMRLEVTDDRMLSRIRSPFLRPLRAWLANQAAGAHTDAGLELTNSQMP